MEIFELKYFLKTAETENIHKAAQLLNISPSAISKAISRLEEELQVRLFEKVGRNIRLTSHGQRLRIDGAELAALEKKIKESYNSEREKLFVRLSGSEIPLSLWGPKLITKFLQQIPGLEYALETTSNHEAWEFVQNHQSDFALFVSSKELKGAHIKKIDSQEFGVFAAKSHIFSKKREVDVSSILTSAFVVPDFEIAGDKSSVANDGWRDDKLLRTSVIRGSSLSCMEGLVREGLCLSYLPISYGIKAGFQQIRVKGCPYTCKQNVYFVRNKLSMDRVWAIL